MKRLLAILAIAILAGTSTAGNLMRWGRGYVVIYPTGDVCVSNCNWTKNTANFYQAISEAVDGSGQPAGDGDTTYMDAGHTASTTYSEAFDLGNSATYAAANTKIRYLTIIGQGRRNNDQGSGGVGTVLTCNWRIASTNYSDGTMTFALTTDATFVALTKSYVNPATGLAWTAGDVDALQIEVNRVVGSVARFDARLTALAVVVAYDREFIPVPSTRIHGGGN